MIYDDQFLWTSPEDAHSMMKEYMKEEGVTDLSEYKIYELELTGTQDGESFMGFGSSVKQELEPDGGEKQ